MKNESLDEKDESAENGVEIETMDEDEDDEGVYSDINRSVKDGERVCGDNNGLVGDGEGSMVMRMGILSGIIGKMKF